MIEKLGPLDLNFWNLDSPTTRQVITAYCLFDHCPDLEQLKSRLLQVIELFPRLKCFISTKQFPSWVSTPNLVIENHLRSIIDQSISTPKELKAKAEEVFSTGLDPNQPLWKFTLISNHHWSLTTQTSNPLSLMLFMIHHSLADGLGGLEILNALADSTRINESRETIDFIIPRKNRHRYLAA